MARPTIISTSRDDDVARADTVPIVRPSRSTVTRSEIVITSASLWLMKMTAMPLVRKERMTS